jgi:hypothetical protein
MIEHDELCPANIPGISEAHCSCGAMIEAAENAAYAEIAALRAGAIEAEARMYVVIEDNEALRAEIDRMRRERDDAINARSDSLDYARAERAEAERDYNAGIASGQLLRAEAAERERDRLAKLNDFQKGLIREHAAEVERMRPVVEAAERWYTAGLRDGGATANLVTVMRTYRAASSAGVES